MPYEVGVEDIALLIRPLGNGRIETCIYKDPDNILDEDELDEALQVAVTMSAFFELALDDSTGIMETLKEQLNDKMHEIMSMNNTEYEEDVLPLYTSEGNVLRINRFTKTKGNC